MTEFDNMQERLARIERQLRGEPGEDPIDLQALPLTKLEGHLEDQWLPDAREVVNPKSIGADEIGELPCGSASTAWDGGGTTSQTIPNVTWTWIEFRDSDFDVGGMVSLTGFPSGGAYTALVARVPGKYTVSCGGVMHVPGKQHHIEMLYGSAGGAAGSEASVAHAMEDHGVAGGVDAWAAVVTRTLHLYENDWVAMRVWQNSGVGIQFGGWTASYEAFISAHWLGA